MPRKSQRLRKQVVAKTETPSSPREQQEQSFTYFWKSASPFSQWHESPYTLEINGVSYQYSCAEQGMMHGKALLFGDDEVAAQILATPSPREMKALGRMVRGFNDKIWNEHRIEIVHCNSVAKFTQNRSLCEALLNTTGDLVEASPYDRIWGVGLKEADARKMNPHKWHGLNLLGRILTRVRDEIRQGLHVTAFGNSEQEEAPDTRGVHCHKERISESFEEIKMTVPSQKHMVRIM